MIKIVVDSTGYIEEDMLKQNDIKVVPLKIRFGSKEYKETEFSVDEFYRMLKESNRAPKHLSHHHRILFLFISRLLDEGNEVLSIHLSEKISGTINSARVAIEELKTDKVKIVDSKVQLSPLNFLQSMQ